MQIQVTDVGGGVKTVDFPDDFFGAMDMVAAIADAMADPTVTDVAQVTDFGNVSASSPNSWRAQPVN